MGTRGSKSEEQLTSTNCRLTVSQLLAERLLTGYQWLAGEKNLTKTPLNLWPKRHNTKSTIWKSFEKLTKSIESLHLLGYCSTYLCFTYFPHATVLHGQLLANCRPTVGWGEPFFTVTQGASKPKEQNLERLQTYWRGWGVRSGVNKVDNSPVNSLMLRFSEFALPNEVFTPKNRMLNSLHIAVLSGGVWHPPIAEKNILISRTKFAWNKELKRPLQHYM